MRYISLKLTEEEWEACDRAAAKVGDTVTGWARAMVFKETDLPDMPDFKPGRHGVIYGVRIASQGSDKDPS